MDKVQIRIRSLLVAVLIALCLTAPTQVVMATSENPFPGVPYGAEIPGLSKVITCSETPQAPDDCIRQGGGQVVCPEWSANDITATLRADGSWASAKSWCRNSWLPPTTQADDEDFRNRQQLAIAKATEESQAWNAANPGKQKCVQWGPVVHANGVSTASGGVCANPVEAGSNTTVPSQDAAAVTAPSSSDSSAPSPSPTPSPSASSNSAKFTEDTSYKGSGYPFTRIFQGQLSTSDCPVGYQAANGLIAAIGIGTFTECWPENAWQANRLGGDFWEQFKSTNGTYDVMAEVRRRENVQALKNEAKRVAQAAADQTPGIQRCSKWTGYGESGTECAYTFVKPSGDSTAGGTTGSDSTTTTSPNVTDSTTTGSTSSATTSSVSSGTSSNTSASSPSAQASTDFSQYGIGKPFTKIVEGSVSTSRCPAGFQAASNYFEWLKATECWPEDAWLAYSKGGTTWSSFKQSLGGQSLQLQVEREMRITAVRALALQQAQELSWKTPGLRRCVSWTVFDKLGAECSFVPSQNSSSSGPVRTIVDTSNAVSVESKTVVRSAKGLSRVEWTSSVAYSQLDCPSGFAKETSLDLNGTADSADDTWITECLENKLLKPVDSSAATSQTELVGATAPSVSESSAVVTTESAVVVSAAVDTAVAIASNVDLKSQSVEVKGTATELISYASNIEADDIAEDIADVITRFNQIKTVKKSSHTVLATVEVRVTYTSNNPRRCLIRSGGADYASISFTSNQRIQIKPVRTGSCEVSITLNTQFGNTYSTAKTYKIQTR